MILRGRVMMFLNNVKRHIKAVSEAKKYDNIIFLGYNCEVAFRFFRQYRFVDSSLFAWTGVTLEQLKYFLEYPEKVGLDFTRSGHLLKCENSGILFHGRTNLANKVYYMNEEEFEEEKSELRSRIAYLKDKFFKYSTNGKSTLYIRKVTKEDIEDLEFQEKILYLYNKLQSVCTNDFKLLLIAEKDFYEKALFENENIITRYVMKYNPNDDVTSRKLGDTWGWRIIFTEFQPAVKKKQTKKFKFEECN